MRPGRVLDDDVQWDLQHSASSSAQETPGQGMDLTYGLRNSSDIEFTCLIVIL